MKVLHLTMHGYSGAGRAVLRLHTGLIKAKLDSSVLVLHKGLDSPSIIELGGWSGKYKQLQQEVSLRITNRVFGCHTTFSINTTPSLLQPQINNLNSDLINLHWIGWEFLKIEDLKKFKVPLVWTLHDMWAFTGGCHYSEDCDRYQKSCGNCPQLKKNKNINLSHWIWKRKAEEWKDLNLTVVAPSSWMADCAKSSSLFKNFRIEVIPNGLDLQTYQPNNQNLARQLLNLPQNKKLVLFGAFSAASDRRKGWHLLQSALQRLANSGREKRIELVIFGADRPEHPPDLGFPVRYLGHLNDDSLALVYSAADVFVAPSLQDNLPNTIIEALACGIPCVAFKIGGIPDAIDHQQNGYLAQPFDVEDLAKGISWVLADEDYYQKLRCQAREKAENCFSLEKQANRYLTLYSEILN
jgi:glycosyltransferase involved in cell wall biosynthesis